MMGTLRFGSVAALAAALVLGSVAAAPDASAYLSGDGKGNAASDCFIGLEGYDSGDQSPFGKKGKPAIQCTDCDPACDLDGEVAANGACTFSIAVRVNDAGVAGCTPAALKKVKAKAKTKGTKINFSTSFQPPLDGSSATSAFVTFPVLLKKFGTPKVKFGKGTVSVSATKPKDKDKFTFVCNPLPEGETCPSDTTTTSTVPTTSTTTTTTTSITTSTEPPTSTTSTSSTTSTTGTTLLAGPAFPPVGGTVDFGFVGNNQSPGGADLSLFDFSPTTWTQLYWGPDSGSLPAAGLDGMAHPLSTFAGISGGDTIATWQGVTDWTDPSDSTVYNDVPIQLTITVIAGGVTWVPSGSVPGLDPGAGTGIGAVVDVAPAGTALDFTVKLEFTADIPTDASGFVALSTIPQIGGGLTATSFSGGFYSEP